MPSDALVIVDATDDIATLTINRPTKLNALNYAVIGELSLALHRIEADDAIRAVVLTGSGDRAFSAGADIAEFTGSIARGGQVARREFVIPGQQLTHQIQYFDKPVIAAVNGLAYGGGCEIVEACHLAIAADRALFAKPEIKLGFPPCFGGTQRLPRLIGRKRALKMILTAVPISALDAQAIGLVNDVVPAADVIRAAHVLAKAILEKSPSAIRACIASVERGLNVSMEDGLAIEATWFEVVAESDDVRERLAAFNNRRV
jgi:enoyl-CoA hydratase/carnithine racemase